MRNEQDGRSPAHQFHHPGPALFLEGFVADGEDLVDRVTGKVPAADQKILDAAAAEAEEEESRV